MNDKRSRSLAGEDAIAKLKLELYEAIETKMNASLERDRQFIQGTIAAASKIGGYVVSIVALAITLFGVKTCSDVKSTVETTTKNEIDEQLKKSNPVLAYEKETKRYLEGALVNYYCIMLAAPEQDNRTRLPLPSDLVRMQTILRSPETDDTLFSQIIDILVSISDREEQSKLGSALTELLAAKLPSLSWIERSVAKRVSIVDALARLRYGDARS